MTRSTSAALVATAHHEAGHVIAAITQGIHFAHVTIRPSGDAAGHVRYLAHARSIGQVHKRGIVALAGEAAQRRHNPRSIRGHHGWGDRRAVVSYALDCTGSSRQAEAMAKLWTIQAEELIEHRWAMVSRIANLLLERQKMSESECREAVFPQRITTSAIQQVS